MPDNTLKDDRAGLLETSAKSLGSGTSQPMWRLAFNRNLMRRAALTAAIVGPAIAIINHGDRLFTGQMMGGDWLRVGISFLIPYSVSTASSVLAVISGTGPDD